MIARRRHRRTAVLRGALVAAVLTLGVAGCSGPEPIGDRYDGAGPGALATDPADTGPAVGWVTEGQRFFVTTYGSSSCPTVPTAIEAGADGPRVRMTTVGGPDCTADLGPTSYALDLPERFRTRDRIVVVLRFEDGRVVERALPERSAAP